MLHRPPAWIVQLIFIPNSNIQKAKPYLFHPNHTANNGLKKHFAKTIIYKKNISYSIHYNSIHTKGGARGKNNCDYPKDQKLLYLFISISLNNLFVLNKNVKFLFYVMTFFVFIYFFLNIISSFACLPLVSCTWVLLLN